jgi:anti-sigma regulatory factor (Ser/Thr protein kinase)
MAPLELSLKAGATAPGRARDAVRGWLTQRTCEDTVVDTATLLVTELVTNAVLHASGSGLALSIDETVPDVMHVAVCDGSRRSPRAPKALPSEAQTGGRGLWLVEALASRWGWEPMNDGKRVWFELGCRVVAERPLAVP